MIRDLVRRVCPWWLLAGHLVGLVGFDTLVSRARRVVANLSPSERATLLHSLILMRDQTEPGERALYVALAE